MQFKKKDCTGETNGCSRSQSMDGATVLSRSCTGSGGGSSKKNVMFSEGAGTIPEDVAENAISSNSSESDN